MEGFVSHTMAAAKRHRKNSTKPPKQHRNLCMFSEELWFNALVCTSHCVSFTIDYELNELRISKNMKISNYELRIKRVRRPILKNDKLRINELRIKRDLTVLQGSPLSLWHLQDEKRTWFPSLPMRNGYLSIQII